MNTYSHTQRSQWMVLLLTILAVCLAMAAFLSGLYGTLWVPAVLIAVAIAFTSLTTRVDASGVSWAFTLGWPNMHVPFGDIASLEVTTTNFWLEGLGLHWTIWHGWLWNVSGYGAVMITTGGGNRITIGTDDPQGLYEAIARFRKGA